MLQWLRTWLLVAVVHAPSTPSIIEVSTRAILLQTLLIPPSLIPSFLDPLCCTSFARRLSQRRVQVALCVLFQRGSVGRSHQRIEIGVLFCGLSGLKAIWMLPQLSCAAFLRSYHSFLDGSMRSLLHGTPGYIPDGRSALYFCHVLWRVL